MEDPSLSRASEAYAARLDRTIRGLQARVKEQEAAWEKLRASTAPYEPEPSEDRKAHFQQLRALKLTFESLTEEEPSLPSSESPIPALLALRNTNKVFVETKECITRTETEYTQIKQRLDKELADLHDEELMRDKIETRITSLRGDIEAQTQKSPAQIAKDLKREANRKRDRYARETVKLVKAFNGFVEDHLAAMLAVEELGGPIVGELLDVDETMLEAGFNAQGKAKRSKAKELGDKRQRRIDEIWGPQPVDETESKEPWNEKRASAAEMRELTEQLLNNLVEAGAGGPGAYVELERESAAARFLVRSKVAQFHPKDARKLRLLDFGGDFDDS